MNQQIINIVFGISLVIAIAIIIYFFLTRTPSYVLSTYKGVHTQTFAKETLTAVEFPIANDTSKNWPVRTIASKFVFPKIGYYTVSGVVVFYGTAVTTLAGTREASIRISGSTTDLLSNNLVYSAGGADSSFLPVNALVRITSTTDYLELIAWTSQDGVSISCGGRVNDSELQIAYYDSL